ncbi:MAG: putative Ig domain-containing protein, partial [Acidobacteria bacterium]|nr:putative Ig domain-containing protein [Acidobacteriota bacterium]
TPPTSTSDNVPVKAGSSAASFTIATAFDPDQAANTLGITINGNPTTASSNGVTVSSVAIQPSGAVTANIATTCAATTATFALVVTDNQSATGTGTLTVTVTPNMPPMLSYNNQTVVAATTPTIPPASGPSDNGTFTIGSVSVTPNNGGLGVLLNQSNGVVTVLNALLIGNYTVTVPITDNCGATTNAQFTVTVVCPAITVNPATLPSATINVAYPQTITASPAGGNYTFAVTSGLLPAGLTLNANGSFSGAPAQGGTFNFRVTATGFGGCTGFRDYTLVVLCPTITLSPASLPGGTVGTAYSQTVSASPAGSYSYAVSAGALPTGLTLNAATGAITGTPSASGSFSFTITASAGGCNGSNTYTVTIACPTITLGALANGQAGVAYSQTVSVSPAGSYTFAIITGNLPSGLSLNTTTGVISGLPTVTGTYTFTLRAQTAGGCSGTQSYALVLSCPAVTVSPASLPNGTVGTAYSQSLSASPAGGNYTYAVTSGALPAGLSLNPATGLLSGTPTANGTFNFTVTASGFGGCTGNRSYSVTIGGGGCPTITLPSIATTGTVGTLYNQSVNAAPAGSYTYTLTGSLPPGVSFFSSAALLFGYPAAAGSYSFTISATQGACTGSKSYTVNIGVAFFAARAQMADYNGDGKSDFVAQMADYNGDGKSDFVLRANNGIWRLLLSNGEGANRIAQTQSWGTAGDLSLLGDYDGDGQTDLAVFRPSEGNWYVKRSSDGGFLIKAWGTAGDVPVPGDYDGDGKTDLAVFRPSDGNWYVWRSSDQQYQVTAWGAGYAPYNDVAVPGDYDGDGKTDVAVFRRATGTWLVKRSSDGQYLIKQWGVGTDVPVAADYDGDGKTDFAIWRAGAWYIWQSATADYRVQTWGTATDTPTPGDYDGDGKTDCTVWRGSEGRWYMLRSADGAYQIESWGAAAAPYHDLLVPNRL